MLKSEGQVVVVGESWPALLVARELQAAGASVKVIQTTPLLAPGPKLGAVFIGNGDPKARVVAVMGELGERFFAFSEQNYLCAAEILKKIGVESNEKGLQRDADKEKALTFDWESVASAIQKNTPSLSIVEAKEIKKIEKSEGRYRVTYDNAKLSSDAVVLVSEYWTAKLLPSYKEVIIPVTLHGLYSEASPEVDFSVALFHGGADYAYIGKKGAQFGSYRNLFADKAVGIHPDADPKTLEGLKIFFGPKGWLDDKAALFYSVESVTCDGLPLVGATSEMPGVYVIAGFAAHRENFMFQVAKEIGKGLSQGRWSKEIEIFSTRRFL